MNPLCTCGDRQSEHAKKGPKPDHPSFRTLSKQGISPLTHPYYPTSELAFCLNPVCDCINFTLTKKRK